jgi:glycosyltransferase involved in cell wall biosynthesis
MIKVSIIIPALNAEKHLPSCLESIKALNFPEQDFEIILVDNGSTDRTREIAASYNAIIIENHTKNVSGLRNLGADKASGDILAFVDSDCIVSRNWLFEAARYFASMDVALWGAPPGVPENSSWVQKTWFIVRKKEKQIQTVDWLESMNLFVRKDLFKKIGGFDETLITCEDVDFSYRAEKFGKIISDSSLDVIHLGEARTIKEFFRKETWRGRSNLAGIRSHGITSKELQSLLIPVYFGIFLPAAFLGIAVFMSSAWLMVWLIFFLFPAVAVLARVRKKISRFSDILSLLILIQVYFFSRTIAVLKT